MPLGWIDWRQAAFSVECCGNGPGMDLLAQDPFEVVWRFRRADIGEVRMAVLYSVSLSLRMLPREYVMRLLRDSSEDSFRRSVRMIIKRDTDPNCRELAKSIESTFTLPALGSYLP
jgi:hypothetical protein